MSAYAHGEIGRRQQRVIGSALWAAWADSLGFISELTDEAGLRRRLRGRGLTEPVEWVRRVGGRFGVEAALPAGCYSDDTQLRLATGRAISDRGFDVEAFAAVELSVWPSYALGGGRASRAAAGNLTKSSVPWFGNFFDGWSDAGGNGVAMRIQPHVWAAKDPADPRSYLLDVILNGITTHGHPRALVGAALHAVALGVALASGTPPRLSDVPDLLDIVDDAVFLMEGHSQLSSIWRPAWEKAVGQPFTVGWRTATDECRELATRAREIVDGAASPEGKYELLIAALELRDPQCRGSGTVTSVAAIALAAMLPNDPAAVSRVAAQAMNTDTDTIGTMAAALAGSTDDVAAPVPLMDGVYIRTEAKRLADIGMGRPVHSFDYPDLLLWSPPKSQLDAVGTAGEKVAIAGLGWIEPIKELAPLEGKDGVWQWVVADFGQSFLVKRRQGIRSLPPGSWPERARAVSQQATEREPISPVEVDRRPTRGPANSDGGERVLGGSALNIDEMLDWVARQGFPDVAIGYAVRRIGQEGSLEQLVAFTTSLRQQIPPK